MKVDVITRHAVTNYGSLLQTIAMQHVVESMGHECEIIDYIRDDETSLNLEKTILKSKPTWNNNIIKKALYLTLRIPESVYAGKKFEKARKTHLNLSRRYSSLNQLKEDKPKADVYMTGSDQVWGPVQDGTNDSAYCLSFTKDEDKRIAYAASFGHTDMTSEKNLFFKTWLNRYNQIAVREDSALDILRKLGLNAAQVVDPTLLLDSAFWDKFAQPIKQKKYVLVYQIHNDKRVGEYAKRVSERMNLPLIRISASFHQITREGKFAYLPSIGEFLSYIKNAEVMVTDSFHGTAFALNYNVDFVEVLPNNKTGTRNMSILNMTGLTDRILADENDTSLALKKINYENVNKILSDERAKSLKILKQMIEE